MVRKGFRLKSVLFLVLFSTAGHSFSQDDGEPYQMEGEYRFSINVSPLSALSGAYGAGAEYLLSPKSSVLAEYYFFTGVPAFEFFGETEGHDVKLHWRRHFEPGLNSAFIGFFARFSQTETEAKARDDKELYTGMTLMHLGVNVGQKHIYGRGFCWTWRIGYGLGLTDVKVTGNENVDEDDIDLIKAFTLIFAGLDAEISIGWAF